MKTRQPKMVKAPAPRIGRAAFGAGGNRAFSDPQTMVAPDQAFSAAMAKPQGGAMPAAAPAPVGPAAGPLPMPQG